MISISNFGDLAAVSPTNPGASSHSEFDSLLAPKDAERLYALLVGLGYRVVLEEAPWTTYSGPSPIDDGARGHGVTWWTRFFDYL